MLRSISTANNLKTTGKTALAVFFVISTRPVSSSGLYGTPLLPLMLLTKAAKEKTLFEGIVPDLGVYSRGIAGFTEQRPAFTRAQSAILQSRDFNLRVERGLKIRYPRS